MVADLEVELGPLADLAERDRVLLGLAVRRVGVGEVGKRREQLLARRLDLRELGLELLQLALTSRISAISGSASRPPAWPRRSRRRRDSAAPAAPPPREELAAALVEAEELVELVGGARAAQRRARRLGVVADAPQVEHAPALYPPIFAGRRLLRSGAGRLDGGPAVDPAYLETKPRPGRLAAGHDVGGHDPAREAPVADREEHIAQLSLRWSRFGP